MLTLDFIKNNLLTQSHKLNSHALKRYSITKDMHADIYNIYNKITSIPKCCSKPMMFVNFSKGYKCSLGRSCEKALSKRRETCLDKFGVENTFQSAKIKTKISNVKLERYGDSSYSNTQKISESLRNRNKEDILKTAKKIKETKIERYGDENYSNREKYKETCLEKFGFTNAGAHPIVKNKRETTMLKRYGFMNPFFNAEIQQEIQQKVRITNISSGRWLSDDKFADFKLYSRIVRRETERQDLSDIKGIESRGQLYHLDHKLSVYEGFKYNIPPYLIYSLENLEIIPVTDNL